MDKLNPIYIQQMVAEGQRDIERLAARQQRFASLPKKPSFMARSRQAMGASLIGAGRFIQGRSHGEQQVEPLPLIS
jgi:hypothetical protein